MQIKLIKSEISFLKQEIRNFEKRLDYLESLLEKIKHKKTRVLFNDYLKHNKYKSSTIKMYFNALETIRCSLIDKDVMILVDPIYNLDSYEWVQEIKETFFSIDEFKELNKNKHNTLSAAINLYLKFLKELENNIDFILE